MKTNQRRLRLLALLLAVLWLCGCGHTARAPRYFAYLDAPFSTSLTGSLDGLAFTALIESAGRAEAAGAPLPTGCDFTLTYLSPAALSGVKVTYTAATDEVTVSLGELCAKGDAYAALAAPGLLLLTESAVQRTEKNEDGTLTVHTMDGACRTAAPDGRPLSLTQTADGRHLEVRLGA